MKRNPRTIPKTQADVDKAFDRGVTAGVRKASAIFLTVLCDKFNGGDYIREVWDEITKLAEEVGERRVSVTDLERVLFDEYNIIC